MRYLAAPLIVAALLTTPALAQQQGDPLAPYYQKLGKLTDSLMSLQESIETMKKLLSQRDEEWKAEFAAWCGDRPACGLTPKE